MKWIKASERMPEKPESRQRIFIKNGDKKDVMVYIIDFQSKKGNWCWSLSYSDSKGMIISKEEFKKIVWLDDSEN